MKIVYFDCFSGISGDMILGAFVDAGLDINFYKNNWQNSTFMAMKYRQKRLNAPGYAGQRFT